MIEHDLVQLNDWQVQWHQAPDSRALFWFEGPIKIIQAPQTWLGKLVPVGSPKRAQYNHEMFWLV